MASSDLKRFGVSIAGGLLDKFDTLIAGKGYTNRSEAIRDLIRDNLVETEWQQADAAKEAIGTITLVYDHRSRDRNDRLTHLAHDHLGLVISTLHVHLTPRSCMEVIILKGAGHQIRTFAEHLISTRGVKHGKLVVTGLVEDNQHITK